MVILVLERMSELEQILEEVKEANEVSKSTRKRFWKLVRQIKRERDPDRAEIKIATQIRNILFKLDRGRTYPIWPLLGVQTFFGWLALLMYVLALLTPVSWINIFNWSMSEIITIVIRFMGLFLIIALWYPYGRLMAGAGLGIKLEALCLDEYKEPTLKIDYESFLRATPTNRKRFFLYSGLWTMILALGFGIIGWILAGDILGFILTVFFLCFYVPVIRSGTTSHGRGEMAHYNRERKIERAWKKNE